jgi:hypothetical protein
MSRITLSGNASGTGNFTLASPNSNTDRTLTLPDATGTVNVSGLANEVPAGSAGAPAIYPTGDSNTGIFFPAADTIAFSEGGVESMRIDSSGNLLVGSTSNISNAIIHAVRSQAGGVDAISRTLLNVQNTGATSTTKISNLMCRFASNASNADACIGLSDAVSHNYYFGGNNGGAYVMANSNGVRLSSGGTSWASDSDERVKDIIEPISDAADKVLTLRAVIGKYKTDSEGTRRAFLIAQDVQAVLPEAVFDEQGTLMLAYTETIPLLTAALQEALTEIASMKARITALEAN